MTERETLKLALEALKELVEKFDSEQFTSICELDPAKDAIAAAEEALAQPEQQHSCDKQEPVTHLWECLGTWSAYLVTNGEQANCAPPSWLVGAVRNATTPPQRKPLTHEQRFDLLTKFEPHKNKWEAPAILIDMVEAAHGIKE